MAESTALKPAYLITGTDEAKIVRARSRLRDRAEAEGGPGALEAFEAGEGRRAPDADAFLNALMATSLLAAHRYLLVDGADAWSKSDAERVAESLGSLPPETTVALIAHGKAPASLKKAVEKAGGEVLTYDAPRDRDLPKSLVADARGLGFELELDAARMLVQRLGTRPLRLRTELERLALWAGAGGSVGAADLDAMIADTSEAAIWLLADAVIEGDEAGTLRVAEQLVAQGEALPRIIYSVAPRLRDGLKAARALEAGTPPKDVASSLSMHPYAAKMLVSRVKGRSPEDLDGSIRAMADLELWSRGGSDYSEGVALTMALISAVTGETEDAPNFAWSAT
jgi:DNA polymerase III subunit delta